MAEEQEFWTKAGQMVRHLDDIERRLSGKQSLRARETRIRAVIRELREAYAMRDKVRLIAAAKTASEFKH